MKKIGICLIATLAVFLIGLLGYLGILLAGNYVIDEKKLVMNSATELVDEDGNLITKLYFENREPISIDDIPDHVQEAFVATEDSRFYEHHGLDVKAIGRALYRDILAGGKVEGGSTITQQLAKNVFLTNDKSWLRKTKEAVIAINLERSYSKEKILEMYLNQIYFGHGAYGIQSASTIFFNKSASELSVEEGAMLAGLPKAPSNYSPINHPEESKDRRDLVLTLMEKHDYLTPEEAVRLQGKTLALDIAEVTKEPAYLTYIDMTLQEAKTRYNLSNEEVLRGGYQIVVPLNPSLQKAAYEQFQNDSLFPGSDAETPPQGGFSMMNAASGGVVAVQGGRDYVQKGFNHVTAKRQPGSALKPLAVYAPALEKKEYSPYTLLKDEKIDYDGYSPSNYNNQYKGKLSLYDAVRVSANAPAVWLLNEIGIPYSKSYLEKSGLSIEDSDLKIALGGIDKGVSPFEMMAAYRPFIEGGKQIKPFFISKLYNNEGKLVGEANQTEEKVYTKQTAWYMTRILEGVVKNGTATSGKSEVAVAGKTGTTSYEGVSGGSRDAWFVGFTPEYVGAVWMGYDRTTDSHYLSGGSEYPVQLFKEVVNASSNENSQKEFKKPSGVKDMEKPISLPTINDVKAEFDFLYGLPAVKLKWTASSDERVVYHIYEIKDGEREQIAEVDGTGEYTRNSISFFGSVSYEVVPFNPLTDQEGEVSNEASVSLFDRFKNSE
ncbi:transglycosylase domain-containing protein [Pseudalkalibacillus hwajinpoensis]|uniref:transglycosylase domain-containing protein n=1 Tax=Guptibacillus hwajinpoensis TaxID=208199 RepID=UPI001CD3ECFC|nr:PBP1A family penicillin-binding protein [Pseudalkalibacillus hwajinpoensis]MCA0993058.1 PBP1A family penicillin-binding protein [Pseudalkalibacillus hwajinpoensis]